MPGTNLWIPFQIQLDSSGSGELGVGAPALGYNWQAFCTLNPAPAGQSQTISVSGQVVASGARQSGPFAAGSGQGVTVTVAGGTASSKVAGVLQGAILPGVAAQAPLPGNGNLFEISGGVIDATITGPVDANITNASLDVTGPVSISAGQTGVNVQTETPPKAMGSITVASGASSGSLMFTPDPGATALRVLLYTTSFWSNETVQALGATSGYDYFQGLLTNMSNLGASMFATNINGNFESITVKVTLLNPASGNYTLGQVFECFGESVIDVVTSSLQPVGVGVGGGASGTPLVAWPLDSTTNIPQVVPMPLAPDFDVVVNTTLAANASATLISGVSGQSIRLRRVQLQTTAAEQITLRSAASGGTIFWVGNPGAGGSTPDMDFQGFSLGSAVDLVLQNTGSAGTTITGRITADQY